MSDKEPIIGLWMMWSRSRCTPPEFARRFITARYSVGRHFVRLRTEGLISSKTAVDTITAYWMEAFYSWINLRVVASLSTCCSIAIT